MPFKSESQRRFLFAKHPTIAREFADATPKGTTLPEKVKSAYLLGVANALTKLGFSSGNELRLKLPTRQYHGLDAGHGIMRPRPKSIEQSADGLVDVLNKLEAPESPNTQVTTRDHLDRQTAWGAPSNLQAGDTANRMSDMGQDTHFGGV